MGARVKRLVFNTFVIESILGYQPDGRWKLAGMPSEYKSVNVSFDPVYHDVTFFVESPSFAPVPQGSEIPILKLSVLKADG